MWTANTKLYIPITPNITPFEIGLEIKKMF